MRARRAAAELFGTFMLVFIGPGAAAVDAWSHGGVSHAGVALAFGFVILAGVYALGHISGAHFNPAVTTGFWIARRFPGNEVAPYILAQLAGATLGGFALRATIGDAVAAAATVPAIPLAGAFGVELVLTLFLMIVILAVATDARVAGPIAGVAVGLTVAFDAMMGGRSPAPA